MRMILYSITGLVALVLLFGFITYQDPKGEPREMEGKLFPAITGNALSGEEVTFPQACEGKVALVCVVFIQRAQFDVNTWINPFRERYPSHDQVARYEVPMIGPVYVPAAGWIDNGMRGGIPQNLHREVVTYYGPLKAHKRALGCDDRSTCYTYLLDREGVIKYFKKGPATDTDLQNLYAQVDALL